MNHTQPHPMLAQLPNELVHGISGGATDEADTHTIDARDDVDVTMYVDLIKCITNYVTEHKPWSITDEHEAYCKTVQFARAYVHTMRFAITRCVEPSPDAIRALDSRIGLWRATQCERWANTLCCLLTAIIALPDHDDDPTTWSVHTRVGLVRAWIEAFSPLGST